MNPSHELPPDITATLARWRDGEPQAFAQLIPLIYQTLRDLARQQRSRHQLGSLDTTALVHETYLNLAERHPGAFPDRTRFYAYVGCIMRSILVDQARREQALKSGGDVEFVDVSEQLYLASPDQYEQILSVDRALQSLAEIDAQLLTLVELRFFAGLPIPEVASAMGLSPRSVDRLWQKARLTLGVLL